MTPEQFAYWLQGFVELQETDRPSQQQWDMIKEHLTTVFKKKTKLVRTPWNNQTTIKNAGSLTPKFPFNTITC